MNLAKGIGLPYKVLQAYNQCCKNLCAQLQIPQTAFDILMFLGNNPQYNTARDVVEIRGIKANLVSVNVDKLVLEGLVERTTLPGDRRKSILVCTDKAQPFIDRGRKVQRLFFENLFRDIGEAQCREFFEILDKIDKNAGDITKGTI